MSTQEEYWIPLVDEPIGALVTEIQEEHPEIAALVDTPRKLLAFRTFAYIRVGIVLGRLLVDLDLNPPQGTKEWAEKLARDPRHREELVREVRAVAEEIAADPEYDSESRVGPDDAERARFTEFAKRRLGADQ